jgi:hypothetical protein
MNDIRNRRSASRSLNIRASLVAEIGGKPLKIIFRDITNEGLSFECDRDLEANRTYSLAILQYLSKKYYDLIIRICWKTVVGENKYIYGAQFINSDIATVASIIEELRGVRSDENHSRRYRRALTVMRDATVVPHDRRRGSRRQQHRRETRNGDGVNADAEHRQKYRRSQFDRRGINASFTCHQGPSQALDFLSNFSNWCLSGKNFLEVMGSSIDESTYCLKWESRFCDVPIHWRSLAHINKETKTILFELLDGELDVFMARIWIESAGKDTIVNFTLTANIDMGTFERLLGPIFKGIFEDIFIQLVDKMQKEMESSHAI